MIDRITERSREWAAWTGDLSELEKLGREVESLFEKRKASLLREFDRANDQTSDDGNIENRVAQEVLKRERREVEEAARFKVTIVDGHDKVAGSLLETLAEVDRRTTRFIAFECEFGWQNRHEELSVSLSSDDRRAVAKLHVKSTDSGWAREAFAHLTDQVERGVPRWSWLVTDRGSFWFGILNGILAALLVTVFLWPILKSPDARQATLFVALPLSLLVGYPSEKLTRWLFPPFEVTSAEGSPRGTRSIAYIGSLVVAFVTGIVVNMVS